MYLKLSVLLRSERYFEHLCVSARLGVEIIDQAERGERQKYILFLSPKWDFREMLFFAFLDIRKNQLIDFRVSRTE